MELKGSGKMGSMLVYSRVDVFTDMGCRDVWTTRREMAESQVYSETGYDGRRDTLKESIFLRFVMARMRDLGRGDIRIISNAIPHGLAILSYYIVSLRRESHTEAFQDEYPMRFPVLQTFCGGS